MTNREEIERRRTFAIISHPDAGKTTLTEKLLLYSFEPSLILVCDSNTGSVTRTEMAAMIDVRMSEGS